VTCAEEAIRDMDMKKNKLRENMDTCGDKKVRRKQLFSRLVWFIKYWLYKYTLEEKPFTSNYG